MSALHGARPQPKEVGLTQEQWVQFSRDYRLEFDFCRILQGDYIAASTLYFQDHLNAQPEARAMVRCFGSLLDGVTTSMRSIAVATGKLFGRPLNPFLQEKVEERGINAYQRIYHNYRLIGEFLPRSPLAATTDGFWDELHQAIEIRNRIVHPRCARDLEVTVEEAERVTEIGDELSDHVNKFAYWLLQKEQKLLWEHTIERRRLYRKIGRNEQCPCGSGRKYKSCCVAAATAA